MARGRDNLFEVLSRLPWWVSVVVGATAFVALRFIIPSISFGNLILDSMAAVAPKMACFAVVFLLPAAVSAFNSFRKGRLVERQADIDSIRSLSWKEFEELVAEAYRRQGYAVQENVGAGPDGGVDLVLRKDGELCLVQCKQWRASKVGVKVVREMFGLMAARQADRVIIATSGHFTGEARTFASWKPIVLIEGHELERLIYSVQAQPNVGGRRRTTPDPVRRGRRAPMNPCPRCGRELVVRTAKRGRHPGSKFWGCSGYPSCTYTRNA